jgi:hypothetical protein
MARKASPWKPNARLVPTRSSSSHTETLANPSTSLTATVTVNYCSINSMSTSSLSTENEEFGASSLKHLYYTQLSQRTGGFECLIT